jgi:hypothetical protein
MSNITIKAARNKSPTASQSENAAANLFKKNQTLIDTLHKNGIDISTADEDTRSRYQALDKHRPTLHPVCALWFARQCLAQDNKDLFCEVVNTFHLKRLRGIDEHAEVVAHHLKDLPGVHQIGLTKGCNLTVQLLTNLQAALSEPRGKQPFELILFDCTIESSALSNFVKELSTMQSLGMLSLLNLVPSDDTHWHDQLGKAIGESRQLQALRLDMPDPQEEVVRAIGRGIRQNRSLVEVQFRTPGSIKAPQWMMNELARPDASDPSQPGQATPALATLVLAGDRAKGTFDETCLADLAQTIHNCPLLTRVRVNPAIALRNPKAREPLRAICDQRPIYLGIDLTCLAWVYRSKNRKLSKAVRRSQQVSFTRRTSPSNVLCLPSKTAVIEATAHLLDTNFFPRAQLPREVWHRIAGHMLDGSTSGVIPRLNKNAMRITAQCQLDVHAQRARSLIDLSWMFGQIELAHLMMGLPLAGIPMSPELRDELQLKINQEHPNAERLNAILDEEGRGMLEDWKQQEWDLLEFNRISEFSHDHARLKTFRMLFPHLKEHRDTISVSDLSRELKLHSGVQLVTNAPGKVLKSGKKALIKLWDHTPSPRREKKD